MVLELDHQGPSKEYFQSVMKVETRLHNWSGHEEMKERTEGVLQDIAKI